MKSGLVAFGALIWAAPVLAQDPLAPLSAQSKPASTEANQPDAARQSVTLPPAATPVQATSASPAVAVPKDWRGVFDAIDSRNWASARAGIAALPPGPLTAFANGELYTAKGSPVVDLASIQALLVEAPELPKAEQLARLAVTRGATPAPAIHVPRATVNLGSAPGRYRSRPVQGEPAADQLRGLLDSLVKVDGLSKASARLQCVSQFYQVAINDSLLADLTFKFHYKSKTQQRGILAYVDIRSLPAGLHHLTVGLPPDMYKYPEVAVIPFYKEETVTPYYVPVEQEGEQRETYLKLKPLLPK